MWDPHFHFHHLRRLLRRNWWRRCRRIRLSCYWCDLGRLGGGNRRTVVVDDGGVVVVVVDELGGGGRGGRAGGRSEKQLGLRL